MQTYYINVVLAICLEIIAALKPPEDRCSSPTVGSRYVTKSMDSNEKGGRNKKMREQQDEIEDSEAVLIGFWIVR